MQERRQHTRYKEPALFVWIDRQRYRTADWSLGGFRLNEFHGELAPRQKVSGRIAPGRFRRSGGFVAQVVRVSKEHGIGFRFLEISPSMFDTMSRLG